MGENIIVLKMIKEHNPWMNWTRISIYIKIWLYIRIPKWVIFIKRAFLEYENFLCSPHTLISFQSWIYALLHMECYFMLPMLNGFWYIIYKWECHEVTCTSQGRCKLNANSNETLDFYAVRNHMHEHEDEIWWPWDSSTWVQLQSSWQHFT